jgi:hypothetical protein
VGAQAALAGRCCGQPLRAMLAKRAVAMGQIVSDDELEARAVAMGQPLLSHFGGNLRRMPLWSLLASWILAVLARGRSDGNSPLLIWVLYGLSSAHPFIEQERRWVLVWLLFRKTRGRHSSAVRPIDISSLSLVTADSSLATSGGSDSGMVVALSTPGVPAWKVSL